MGQRQAQPLEERSVGKKSKRTETDLMPFYDKWAEIFFIIEAKKREKRELDKAKEIYDQCCQVAADKEEELLRIIRE